SRAPEPANQAQPVTANDLGRFERGAKDQFQRACLAIHSKTFARRRGQPKTKTDIEQWNSRNPRDHRAQKIIWNRTQTGIFTNPGNHTRQYEQHCCITHRTETLPAGKPEERVGLQQTRPQSPARLTRTILQPPAEGEKISSLSSAFLPHAWQ